MQKIKTIIEELPSFLHKDINAIAKRTIQDLMPISISLVGEFSTGKSSLINALLGEQILPTACNETTALPTFIQYAPIISTELVYGNGENEQITLEKFAQYTIDAPDNTLYSKLYHPSKWLDNMVLIDLPGLSSQSERHSDYTIAQIKASDVVIYMLASRGTTNKDLEFLRLIHQYGKSVMLVVGHWDDVEESVKEGEQAPDLNEWQLNIAEKTGLDLVLVGVSKYGHGCDEILNFLTSVKKQRKEIRTQRFHAELAPLLKNALIQLHAEEESCNAHSSDDKEALRTKILHKKEALLKIKNELYNRSNEDQKKTTELSKKVVEQQKEKLIMELNQLSTPSKKEEWEKFMGLMNKKLQTRIVAIATELKNLSKQYGKLELSQIEVKELQIHIPPPEEINTDDFLDIAQLSQLQEELAKINQNIEIDRRKLDVLPEADMTDTSQQLKSLLHERSIISQQELPKVREVTSNNNGSKIGKTIGQLLDVGLIVAAPYTAATKGASILSQSSKVIKAAQVIKSPELNPIINFTSKLSLSYFGEQIGKCFDGPDRVKEHIDPEAKAEQERYLQEQDRLIFEKRRELQRLDSLQQQNSYSEWALEKNTKEKERVKNSIKNLQDEAIKYQKERENEANLHQQYLLDGYQKQLIDQILINFTQQSRHMTDLLRVACKEYWKNNIESSLEKHLENIDLLSDKIKDMPEKKEKELLVIKEKMNSIENFIKSLDIAYDG